MPVHACALNGKPGYKWGGSGACYTYKPGDKAAEERAKARARAQGRAAYANGYKDGR
jgi:hypothetical protein